MTARDAEHDPSLWVWGEDAERPRFLHTMLTVENFESAMRFYVDGLGMSVLDCFDIEATRSTCVFLGFDGYDGGGCVELVHRWDPTGELTHGTGYGHVSVGVPDVGAMVAKLESMGFAVTRPTEVLIPGGPEVSFVQDDDGYAVELIQTARRVP